MWYLKIILLLGFCILFENCLSRSYNIRLKAIQCYNIDKNFVPNATCRLRAVRGKLGVLDRILYYQNMSDIWFSGETFYRNTNGRYIPYILKFSFNLCEIAEKAKLGNLLEQRMIKFLAKFDKTIYDGCPIKGPFNMTDYEFNTLVGDLLPPVIPEGDYMYNDHLHSSSNHTYIMTKYFFNVRSIGVADLSIFKVGK